MDTGTYKKLLLLSPTHKRWDLIIDSTSIYLLYLFYLFFNTLHTYFTLLVLTPQLLLRSRLLSQWYLHHSHLTYPVVSVVCNLSCDGNGTYTRNITEHPIYAFNMLSCFWEVKEGRIPWWCREESAKLHTGSELSELTIQPEILEMWRNYYL